MIFLKGYNDKAGSIKVQNGGDGIIELWISQDGLEGKAQETLSYITPNELHQLFLEVKRAGHDIFS